MLEPPRRPGPLTRLSCLPTAAVWSESSSPSLFSVSVSAAALHCAPLACLARAMASLGASADDAATDDILDAGEARAGRTEWEDALIKHNIAQADTQQRTDDDRQLAAAEERAVRDRLADAQLDELDELEDEVDDTVLRQYRSVSHSVS